jgi:acyl-CoA thioesterase-2
MEVRRLAPIMASVLANLLSALDLEELDVDLYRGRTTPAPGERVFGGHVAAQALVAAGRTVPGWSAHSLHAYFLRPANPALPIDYTVDRIRDGKSFVTRLVVASQHGKAILNLSASFHAPEPGFVHQVEMPNAPPPEHCPSLEEWMKPWIERVPAESAIHLTRERPIELRPVDPIDLLAPRPGGIEQSFWMRANGTLPDDPLVHQGVAVYGSDSTLLDAIMRPHGKTFLSPDIVAASLDHAMWLERPFRMDEWILYHQTSPSAFGARGLALGHFFTEDGILVASVAQEGLIRLVDPALKK